MPQNTKVKLITRATDDNMASRPLEKQDSWS
jgi:hypothetical protein